MKKNDRRGIKLAVALPAAGLLLGSCASVPLQSSVFQLTGFSAALTSAGRSAAAGAGIDTLAAAGGAASPIAATDPAVADASLSAVQQRILAGAHYFLGKTDLVYGGRHYTYDCTGTILAIYAYAGINLLPRFDAVTGNGVERLYKIMRANNLLVKTQFPQPGDIVFWDNTYDENGNGLWDDELTHAGIVIGVTRSGEITYEHQNYARGIVTERMNLIHPNEYMGMLDGVEQIINSPMRMRGSPPGPDWLSGQLFHTFGRGFLLAG